MNYIAAVAVLLICALTAAADEANIAYVATVTATPKLASDNATAVVDGNTRSALTFEVGTEGEGVITFTFDEPREVSGVRLYQSHEVYYTTAYVIEADLDGDGTFEKTLAEAEEFPLSEWAEHHWEPVAVKGLRFRSVAGVSKGKRAHPALAEVEIIGPTQPDDLQKANAAGIAVPKLPDVRPLERTTPLIVNGRPPAVIAPQDEEYQVATQALLDGLVAAGVKAELVPDIEAADPAKRTVICLGNMLNNPLIERLYWNRYTFANALVPGPGQYLLHTVYDPYPYNGGNNVIVIGCSDVAGAELSVPRFLQALQDGKLPYIIEVGPEPALTPAEADKIAAKKPDPTFCELTVNANLYLQTGSEAYANKAIAAMQIMAEMYAPGGERESFIGSSSYRKMPWPEETSSWQILCAWDAFEECALISDDLRLDFTNALLQFVRDLVPHVSGYANIGKRDLVSWNHTTFPLLGVHFGARYFHRYYGLADMPEKLDKARACLLAQAKSWKPQEDADSYLTLTTAHSQIYSLAENQMDYFTSGNMKKYADYMVAICDNQGLASGFGDSGVSSRPNLPQQALPLALWWTGDGGYKWLLQQYTSGAWRNPYERGIEPVPADRFTGVNVFMTDPQVYEWVQTYPSYNEPFAKSDVPEQDSFDKISFRENWNRGGQYLLLDGHSRGKHLHYDGNSIIEFVEGGERWLLDHDYLTRNTTEHTMVSILRNGRCDKLVPSLSGLTEYADVALLGYTNTYTRAYNGCDWQRKILWHRGEWFLIADTVVPREDDYYDFDLTWKTIDEAGNQHIVNGKDFVAERGAAAETSDCLLADDETASGGRALLMDRSTSRIAFGVDLPAGEYSLAVIGYGVDSSSDSLWISVDLGDKQSFHMNKGRYGRSAADHALTSDTPKVTLEGDGPHLLLVTLRERQPVRVDRFIFQDANGETRVYEAESLPPPPEVSDDLTRAFHIKPAAPLDAAWVTNHERAGIVLPVSILHQRKSGQIQAGDAVTFASLMYVSRRGYRRDLTPVQIAHNLVAIKGSDPALALLGDVDSPAVSAELQAAILSPDYIFISRLRSLNLAGIKLSSTAPIDIVADLSGSGVFNVIAPEGGAELEVEVAGELQSVTLDSGRSQFGFADFPSGRLLVPLIQQAINDAQPVADAGRVTAEREGTKPLWSAFEPDGLVWRIKAADLHDGNGQRLFVCRGPVLHCLDTAGKLLWSFSAKSLVRDVAFGDVRDNPGDEIVVGSADTYIYILSAAGELLDQHEMRGMPWARSFGDRAYSVFNLLVGDITANGKPDILASMANYDLQALTADWQLLWKHDYALHGSMAMSFEDTDGDGSADAIFLADKYGSSKACGFDGTVKYRRYTSIGDVCYAVADLDGDGKVEVITGSSTGDLRATPFADPSNTLWRFDNFGYPANRLCAGDVNGDGNNEIVLASGTGYLYVLDGSGEVLWQDRAGSCVNDAIVIDRPGGSLVAYCDESGLVRIADGGGELLSELRTSAAPRFLATLGDGADAILAVALSDGHVVSYPLP